MNTRIRYTLLAGTLLATACSNPQKAAETTIEKAQASLDGATGTLDPEKRVKAYDTIIKDVEGIAKKYPKTPIGQAIAAGRPVNGISVAELTQKRDEMDARAKCYANPTVECLTPFGSGAADTSGSDGSQGNFAAAEQLVCDRNFKAADKALDAIKINTDAYAKELIQVGFAAAKCDKPDEVKAAIAAYMQAEPAQSQQRAMNLLGVLGTPEFSPAYPMILKELEDGLQSGAITAQDAANVTLTLAADYARNGDAKAAMEKYTYFTDTLHYQADLTTLEDLSTNLMADGDMTNGIALTEYNDNPGVLVPRVRKAATVLAMRLDLVGDTNTAAPKLASQESLETYFAPVPGVSKAAFDTGADAIEAELDTLAVDARPSAQTLGDIGIDNGYTQLALVREKLGETDKAKALVKKAVDYRTRMTGQAGTPLSWGSGQTRALLAIRWGDLEGAANIITTSGLSADDYGRLLMVEGGRTLDAKGAIALANMISSRMDLWHCYDDIIPVMAEAGKGDEVEKLIEAFPGQVHDKENFYWDLVDGMVARGDVSGAKTYAKKHDLVKDDDGVYKLDARLMSSDKIAGNRGKAEPIIREMFQFGETKDKAANASGGYDNSYSRGQSYQAEHAAELAFSNGYTDLGIELYQKATYKDHRPLLHAFTDKISKSDMTKVLMLAQDNATSAEYLSYVINSAIRHLQKTAG